LYTNLPIPSAVFPSLLVDSLLYHPNSSSQSIYASSCSISFSPTRYPHPASIMDLDTLKLQLKIRTRDLYSPPREFLKDDLLQTQYSRDLLCTQNAALHTALQACTQPNDLDIRLANTKGELANARELVEKLEDELSVEKGKVGNLGEELKGLRQELEKCRKQNGLLVSRLEGKTTSRAATPSKTAEKPPRVGIDKSSIKPFSAFSGLLEWSAVQAGAVKNRRKPSSMDLTPSSLVKCG